MANNLGISPTIASGRGAPGRVGPGVVPDIMQNIKNTSGSQAGKGYIGVPKPGSGSQAPGPPLPPPPPGEVPDPGGYKPPGPQVPGQNGSNQGFVPRPPPPPDTNYLPPYLQYIIPGTGYGIPGGHGNLGAGGQYSGIPGFPGGPPGRQGQPGNSFGNEHPGLPAPGRRDYVGPGFGELNTANPILGRGTNDIIGPPSNQVVGRQDYIPEVPPPPQNYGPRPPTSTSLPLAGVNPAEQAIRNLYRTYAGG